MFQNQKTSLTAIKFIRTISTVRHSITVIAFVDALFHVGTLELSRCAGDGRAALLISLVKTVIITITNPALRDAVTRTGACELIVCTGLLSWEKIYNMTKWSKLKNKIKLFLCNKKSDSYFMFLYYLTEFIHILKKNLVYSQSNFEN